jgi:8-oxo-dGTP pyrophosphatase MutT (NUDIX family)
MFDGANEVVVQVPMSGAEPVMIPVIRAIVENSDGSDSVLLQRRSNPSESVFGLLELPGGTWRAAESPEDAIGREVLEETGILLTSVGGIVIDHLDSRRAIATMRPLAVIAGVNGSFPAIHVIVVATGSGTPGPCDGESFDVQWWSIESVRDEVANRPEAFVPSTLAAINAYVGWGGSESG